MCSANDVLFAPILAIIYWLILWFLFIYNCQGKHTPSPQNHVKKLYLSQPKSEKSQPSITTSNRTISRQLGKEIHPQGKDRKYPPALYLSVIEHLDKLSHWRIYCLCISLGISLDYDNKKQKPIDFIKAEIRSYFRDSPQVVMKALRTI